jgi:hypothetical protein
MGCSGLSGAFDFEGSDADPITFAQDVAGGNGRPIDADEIALGFAFGNALGDGDAAWVDDSSQTPSRTRLENGCINPHKSAAS